MKDCINTEVLSMETIGRLLDIDALAIYRRKPEDYMGMGYFWACEYKHTCRALSYAKRRRLFKELCSNATTRHNIGGESEEHARIIGKYEKYCDWAPYGGAK